MRIGEVTNKEIETHRNRRTGEIETKKRNSVYAGDLNNNSENIIEKKKKEAQEKALKVVSEAFENDKQLDDTIGDLKERASQALSENAKMAKEIEKYTKEKDGKTEDEQKEIDKVIDNYKSKMEENTGIMADSYGSVRGINIERAKTHPMIDADNEAEDILSQASKDVVGMLVDEARDHIDEEQKKAEEAAKKKAEKEEEQEKIEQKIIDNSTDTKKEVKDILDKMKLLEEDIKGAQVDEQL